MKTRYDLYTRKNRLYCKHCNWFDWINEDELTNIRHKKELCIQVYDVNNDKCRYKPYRKKPRDYEKCEYFTPDSWCDNDYAGAICGFVDGHSKCYCISSQVYPINNPSLPKRKLKKGV